eukprot:1058788-Amphidinium_carterae.2
MQLSKLVFLICILRRTSSLFSLFFAHLSSACYDAPKKFAVQPITEIGERWMKDLAIALFVLNTVQLTVLTCLIVMNVACIDAALKPRRTFPPPPGECGQGEQNGVEASWSHRFL